MPSWESARKNPKLLWSVVAIGSLVLAGAAAIGWYASDDKTSDRKPGSSAARETPSDTRSTMTSDVEDRLCKKRIKGSPNADIDIEAAPIHIKDGKFDIDIVLRQTSGYVAMDVQMTVKFINGDKDVTSELGEEFDPGDWDGTTSVSSNADNIYGDVNVKSPSNWVNEPIELDVTIERIGYWCVPNDQIKRKKLR